MSLKAANYSSACLFEELTNDVAIQDGQNFHDFFGRNLQLIIRYLMYFFALENM